MASLQYITNEKNVTGSKSIGLADDKLEVKPDNTGNVQFALTENGLKGTVHLPAVPVDVKITGLNFENGKLKGTLSDGTEVETNFTLQVITQALQNATEQDKQAFKTVLLDIIKGEEVKDTSDTVHGYLLPA